MQDVQVKKQVDGGAWLNGLLPEGHEFKPSQNHGSSNNNYSETLRDAVTARFKVDGEAYHFPANCEVIVYRKYLSSKTGKVAATVFLPSGGYYKIFTGGNVVFRSP